MTMLGIEVRDTIHRLLPVLRNQLGADEAAPQVPRRDGSRSAPGVGIANQVARAAEQSHDSTRKDLGKRCVVVEAYPIFTLAP